MSDGIKRSIKKSNLNLDLCINSFSRGDGVAGGHDLHRDSIIMDLFIPGQFTRNVVDIMQ